MKKDPATMPAAAINRELDALGEKRSQLNGKLIAAGRGHELADDTLRQNDALSNRWKEMFYRTNALRNEVEHRAGPGMTRLPRGFGPLK